MSYSRRLPLIRPEQDRGPGTLEGEADTQISWHRALANAAAGPVALVAQGNNYTFTLSDTNNLITADIEAKITANAHYVIDLISHYVSWQGVIDFIVNVRPGSESTYPAADGILPTIAQITWNGTGYDNDTVLMAKSGVDTDPSRPDAGCYIFIAADGTIRNYGYPVWFDPNPQFGVPVTV